MPDFQKLQALGLDTGEGLLYCAEDPEFYEEMLREYVAEARAGTEDLEAFFTARAWDRYAIRAHSVKSTSRMIGARDLSEQARGLEAAAKERDERAVTEAHGPFLEAYRALAAGIPEGLA